MGVSALACLPCLSQIYEWVGGEGQLLSTGIQSSTSSDKAQDPAALFVTDIYIRSSHMKVFKQ